MVAASVLTAGGLAVEEAWVHGATAVAGVLKGWHYLILTAEATAVAVATARYFWPNHIRGIVVVASLLASPLCLLPYKTPTGLWDGRLRKGLPSTVQQQ